MGTTIRSSIEPWLTLNVGEKAVDFYKSAFDTVETYRLQDHESEFVAKLSVHGANFWIGSDANAADYYKVPVPLDAINVRMILIVDEPDLLFSKAIEVGATEIFPVGEQHGWRLGRLSDPFGLHWEIG